MTTKETSGKNVSGVEPRTSRALEEYLTVLHDDESGLCEVYSESGEEYVVDPQNGACECPDFLHNLNGDELCKHARRARFALGRDAVYCAGCGTMHHAEPSLNGATVMVDARRQTHSPRDRETQTPPGECAWFCLTEKNDSYVIQNISAAENREWEPVRPKGCVEPNEDGPNVPRDRWD